MKFVNLTVVNEKKKLSVLGQSSCIRCPSFKNIFLS